MKSKNPYLPPPPQAASNPVVTYPDLPPVVALARDLYAMAYNGKASLPSDIDAACRKILLAYLDPGATPEAPK